MSTAEFAILGAGAIGSILGAHLARAGHSVVMLIRERRAQQIQAGGLRIKGLSDFAVPVQTLTDASKLRRADVLIVNQHELAVYLGRHEERATPQAALAARTLISRDDQLVIVTLGASGAVAVRAGCAVHVPAFPVVPRDAVGAGDCFVGALCAMLDRAGDARPTDEALLIFANAAAALCTQKPGAVPAMPLRSEVEAFIAAHPNEGRPI